MKSGVNWLSVGPELAQARMTIPRHDHCAVDTRREKGKPLEQQKVVLVVHVYQ